MDQLASRMRDEQQDVQRPEGDRLDGEQVPNFNQDVFAQLAGAYRQVVTGRLTTEWYQLTLSYDGRLDCITAMRSV